MTGAAGGLSGGLWAVHGATLEPGAPWILDALDFDARMRAARAVVTGEGKLDEQTLAGQARRRDRDAHAPGRRPAARDRRHGRARRVRQAHDRPPGRDGGHDAREIEAAAEDLGAPPGDRGRVDARAIQQPEARQVVALAQDQARGMGHGQVGTEHLLLGLIGEADGRGRARVREARRDARRGARRGRWPCARRRKRCRPGSRFPSARARRATLEASLRQALGLKDTVIGTEHILLALLIERDGARRASSPPSRARRTCCARPLSTERTRRPTPDPHDDGDALLALAEGSGVAGRALAGARRHPRGAARGDRAGAQRLVTRTARGGT